MLHHIHLELKLLQYTQQNYTTEFSVLLSKWGKEIKGTMICSQWNCQFHISTCHVGGQSKEWFTQWLIIASDKLQTACLQIYTEIKCGIFRNSQICAFPTKLRPNWWYMQAHNRLEKKNTPLEIEEILSQCDKIHLLVFKAQLVKSGLYEVKKNPTICC